MNNLARPATAASTLNIDLTTVSTAVFVVRSIRRWRRYVFAAAGAGALLALAIGLSSPPIYEATVMIVPSDEFGTSGLSGGLGSIASQLGDLGDLAGLSSVSPSIMQTLASLSSRANTVAFMHKYNVIQEMYPDAWNPDAKAWKPATGMAKTIAYLTGKPEPTTQEPSDAAAFKRFNEMRTVHIDKQSGTVTVSIEWRDANQAAEWANDLVKFTDNALRQRALTESQHNLAYLRAQAAESSLSDLRQSVYLLAAKELRRSMMASVGSNFSLRVLDPAVPPIERLWPARTFLLVVGTIGGLLFGAIGAVIWEYFAAIRKSVQSL